MMYPLHLKCFRRLGVLSLLLLVCCPAVFGQHGAPKKKAAKPTAAATTKNKAKAAAASRKLPAASTRQAKVQAGSRGRTARPTSREARANARTLIPRRGRAAERAYTRIARYARPDHVTPRHLTYAPPPEPVTPAEPAPEPSYAPPAGPVTPTGSPFQFASNLAPFFRALAAHQQGQADAPDTIRILQFGDSHTAADIFTGAVRASLQAHFGDGGLGFQYPGHPFAGYHLAGSSRSQSSGWFTEGNHFTALGDGDLGLGGISIATFRPNEYVTLGTTCTTFQLHYLRQSGGGRLRFSDNGTAVSEINTGDLDAPPPAPAESPNSSLLPSPAASTFRSGSSAAGTFTYACTGGPHEFTLTTLDSAPVKLFGLVTEQPGVTYECLGLNGAVAPLMLRWNQQLFAEYLRQRDPTLIVLAYGTNEAAQGADTNETYKLQFNRLIDSLHRYVPAAAILVLGPYDRATRIGSRRHSYLTTWGGTARIIEDQQETCRTHGCAYYNEQTRMGGPGSMIRWAAAGLAQGDHTHLTGTGYRELAGALYSDLLTAYSSFEQRASTAAASSTPSTQQ